MFDAHNNTSNIISADLFTKEMEKLTLTVARKGKTREKKWKERRSWFVCAVILLLCSCKLQLPMLFDEDKKKNKKKKKKKRKKSRSGVGRLTDWLVDCSILSLGRWLMLPIGGLAVLCYFTHLFVVFFLYKSAGIPGIFFSCVVLFKNIKIRKRETEEKRKRERERESESTVHDNRHNSSNNNYINNEQNNNKSRKRKNEEKTKQQKTI